MARRRSKRRRQSNDRDRIQRLAELQVGPGLTELAGQLGTLVRPTEYLSPTLRSQTNAWGGRGKPSTTLDFKTLRSIGDNCLLNSAIHMRRQDGIRSLARRWMGRRSEIGWRIVHNDHFREGFDATTVADLDGRIRDAERILRKPHTVHAPSLESVILPLLDDRLCIDRPALNILYGVGGKHPAAVVPVDGATIWPVDVWTDQFAMQESLLKPEEREDPRSRLRARERGIRRVQELFGVDLTTVAWVQVIPDHGLRPHQFLKAEEMIVAPGNLSSRIDQFGFGRSPTERSWVASTIYLFGIGYILDFFQNSFSNMLGLMKGVKDVDAATIVQTLRSQHMGAGRQFYTPIIPLPQSAQFEMLQTRKAGARDMEYSEVMHHCTALVCGHYSEDMESLNLPTKGPGQSSLSEPNRDAIVKLKRSEGLINDGRFLCERFLTPIVQLIDPELMVIWEGVDDEAVQRDLELRTKRIDAGLISENEGRMEEGRAPYPDPIHDQPQWAAKLEKQSALDEEQQAVSIALAAQPPPDFEDGGEGEGDEGEGDPSEEQDEQDEELGEEDGKSTWDDLFPAMAEVLDEVGKGDNDKPAHKKARRQTHYEVETGERPKASTKKCADCDSQASEWDHTSGHGSGKVQAVCSSCHHKREYKRGRKPANQHTAKAVDWDALPAFV